MTFAYSGVGLTVFFFAAGRFAAAPFAAAPFAAAPFAAARFACGFLARLAGEDLARFAGLVCLALGGIPSFLMSVAARACERDDVLGRSRVQNVGARQPRLSREA